jgi:hypothetical protein
MMIQSAYGVADTPRFYQDSSEKRSKNAETSPFAAQLLSSQSLFSSGLMNASGGASIFENRMLKVLNAIAQHIRSNAPNSGRFVSPAAASPIPSRLQIESVYQPLPTISAPVFDQLKNNPSENALGVLSARFESGNRDIEAIGYDRQGGTSYGKYQLSSRAGSMERFIRFLETKAPDWAARLQAAGPADTGSTEGVMPEAWKDIAAEDPVKFGNLQHAFIRRDYYNPARDMIQETTGLDFNEAPVALQEVLWSTAVQHGPTGATRIFTRAVDRFLTGNDFNQNSHDLIEDIFDLRSRQFGSSTTEVQNAVKNRFTQEKQLAFGLLDQPNPNRNS